MSVIIDVISGVFIIGGSFFVLVGAIGFLRMPDVYTRMHAASVIETLGAGLLIMGMLLQAPNFLVVFKLLVLAALFFFFAPVASHAIAQAALAAGVSPILSADRRGRDTSGNGGGAAAGAGSDGEEPKKGRTTAPGPVTGGAGA